MSATRLLLVLAVLGWLGHHGVIGTPEPVREAVRAAEEWRADQIAGLRCRAAVMAALQSVDDDEAVRRLEAACGDPRQRRQILGAQAEAAAEPLERDRRL
jgi:hypothetical protein